MATNDITGVLVLLPPDPADSVSVRTATVVLVLDGGATTLIVDLIGNTGTFPCRIGQDFSITVVDTNVFGDSPPSEPLKGIVGFGTIPTHPGGPGLRFESPLVPKPALALLLSVGLLEPSVCGEPPALAAVPAAITISGSPGTYTIPGFTATPGAVPVPVTITLTIPDEAPPPTLLKGVENHGGLHAEDDPP